MGDEKIKKITAVVPELSQIPHRTRGSMGASTALLKGSEEEKERRGKGRENDGGGQQ